MLHNQRKLFLFGKYSLALLPPKKWLSELGVNKGDHVELEFDRKRKRIVLKFGSYNQEVSETTSSNNVGQSKKNAQLNKSKTVATKTTKGDQEAIPPKKTEEPEDWQSIPEL